MQNQKNRQMERTDFIRNIQKGFTNSMAKTSADKSRIENYSIQLDIKGRFKFYNYLSFCWIICTNSMPRFELWPDSNFGNMLTKYYLKGLEKQGHLRDCFVLLTVTQLLHVTQWVFLNLNGRCCSNHYNSIYIYKWNFHSNPVYISKFDFRKFPSWTIF